MFFFSENIFLCWACMTSGKRKRRKVSSCKCMKVQRGSWLRAVTKLCNAFKNEDSMCVFSNLYCRVRAGFHAIFQSKRISYRQEASLIFLHIVTFESLKSLSPRKISQQPLLRLSLRYSAIFLLPSLWLLIHSFFIYIYTVITHVQICSSHRVVTKFTLKYRNVPNWSKFIRNFAIFPYKSFAKFCWKLHCVKVSMQDK